MPTPVFVASPSPDAGDEVGARAKAVRRERRERGLNAFLGQPIDPGIGVFELKPPPLDDPAAKALKDEKAMEIAASRVTVTSAELTKIKGLWTKYLEEMQSSATGKESATVMGALQESAEIMDRHASALSDLLGHERAIQWRQAVNRARRLELPKEQHGHNNQPHPSAARPSAPAP